MGTIEDTGFPFLFMLDQSKRRVDMIAGFLEGLGAEVETINTGTNYALVILKIQKAE